MRYCGLYCNSLSKYVKKIISSFSNYKNIFHSYFCNQLYYLYIYIAIFETYDHHIYFSAILVEIQWDAWPKYICSSPYMGFSSCFHLLYRNHMHYLHWCTWQKSSPRYYAHCVSLPVSLTVKYIYLPQNSIWWLLQSDNVCAAYFKDLCKWLVIIKPEFFLILTSQCHSPRFA